MNYSTAIFLVNDDVRAVGISYEVDKDGKGVTPFITFKTLDKTLGVGDLVIVPTSTRHGMTVARIETVGVEVDPDDQTTMAWLVGPVDRTNYDMIIKQEAVAIEQMKSAQKRAHREELAKKLMADNPDLAALTNLGVSSSPALAAPPSE